MAFTQDDIDRLQRAISSGTKKIQYGDKITEFHSLDEMLKLLDVMKKDVAGVPAIQDRRTMGIVHTTLYDC